MYFRPGNMIKDFVIEPVKQTQTTTGRATTTYDTEKGEILRGVIASADPDAIHRYDQDGHPITHQIVQRGGVKAKAGDRLVRGHTHYYIQGVDDVASMGIVAIYYVKERTDLDHGSRI